jgi:rRNA maturation RNase YbeY
VASEQEYTISDLSVVFADHRAVTALNEKHLGRTYHTDVLAFDMSDSAGADEREIEGEIYVDLDTALERAPEFDTDLNTEARRYVIHGLLHLMGYEDDEPERRAEMKRLENLYLSFASK